MSQSIAAVERADLVGLYGHATEVSHHLAGRGNVNRPYACTQAAHLVRPVNRRTAEHGKSQQGHGQCITACLHSMLQCVGMIDELVQPSNLYSIMHLHALMRGS